MIVIVAAAQRWTEVKKVSERQEKARRYNLRLEYIARFNRWIAQEPPMILFWRWRKWRNARPVWDDRKRPDAQMDGGEPQ